jgi:hypothetical protein
VTFLSFLTHVTFLLEPELPLDASVLQPPGQPVSVLGACAAPGCACSFSVLELPLQSAYVSALQQSVHPWARLPAAASAIPGLACSSPAFDAPVHFRCASVCAVFNSLCCPLTCLFNGSLYCPRRCLPYSSLCCSWTCLPKRACVVSLRVSLQE